MCVCLCVCVSLCLGTADEINKSSSKNYWKYRGYALKTTKASHIIKHWLLFASDCLIMNFCAIMILGKFGNTASMLWVETSHILIIFKFSSCSSSQRAVDGICWPLCGEHNQTGLSTGGRYTHRFQWDTHIHTNRIVYCHTGTQVLLYSSVVFL